MMRWIFSGVLILLLVLTSGCGASYESVDGDELSTRIYTLDNGLRVYMTVNRDEPRIQANIAVRVGGKNDPPQTTGLAHYFEHLMFKGTQRFGTTDFQSEQPLLEQIETLYETYRATDDEARRRSLYRAIDSLSYAASRIAIPNEYDKLMSSLASEGSNAYTGFDMTVYLENVPVNEFENWARIQADRFTAPVFRGFHTELETVYEEKNMSLTNDARKVYEAMLSGLFPDHPYGTQSVLGTQEHLKNPSLKSIRQYFETYYVANNMAICLSGDLDPTKTLKILNQYFGTLPQKELPVAPTANDSSPTAPTANDTTPEAPKVKTVWGNESESVSIAWKIPAENSVERDFFTLIDYIMYNGKAGLIDLNIIQQQKALEASSGIYGMADHSVFVVTGMPAQGQSLDEVKDLLLEQVALIRKGDFEDWLIEATVNNLKLSRTKDMESNAERASLLVRSFVYGIPWKDEVRRFERMRSITKEQITGYAQRFLQDNYTLVYKKQGADTSIIQMEKPVITPIVMNRDTSSLFFKEIAQNKGPDIEPVFLDYSKDIQQFRMANGLPVLYRQNTDNDLFELTFLFEMGTNHDKTLSVAFPYLNYLGTSQYSPEQIKSAFYKMACSFGVECDIDRTKITLIGLSDQMEPALELLEQLLQDPQENLEAFRQLIPDIEQTRRNAKMNQESIFRQLTQYAVWGPKSPSTHVLTPDQLRSLEPATLLHKIKQSTSYQHRVVYYGPLESERLAGLLEKYHQVPEPLQPVPAPETFQAQPTRTPKVLFASYPSRQLNMRMVSVSGHEFRADLEPIRTLYNEYFGGGMNAIVFQEIREARGLAYAAGAGYAKPRKPEQPYAMNAVIYTQNDKLHDATAAFREIIDQMPESPKAFQIARESLIQSIRTQRINRAAILWNYIQAEDFHLTYDLRKDIYTRTLDMELEDVVQFQREYIRDLPYIYCILGDSQELTPAVLEQYGPVEVVSPESLFGY